MDYLFQDSQASNTENNKADGVYDFVDKNGMSINDMNYPLETEVLNERLIEGEQYEITLNVEVKE